jgi:carbamoyl-phosphate synthase large subunit
MNILVTGIGWAVGIGIVKALRLEYSRDIKIIGTDISPLAPFFYLKDFLDAAYIVPNASKPDYIKKLLQICKKENVDIIFPGTDNELLPLSNNKELFLGKGVKLAVSSPETVSICRDKWLTYNKLKKYVPFAKSTLPTADLKKMIQAVGLPAVIKPRSGWGARDIYTANTPEELEFFIKRVENPVIQESLAGDDYTVDGLADEQGISICMIPRKRILTRAGLSIQGVTEKNTKMIEIGETLARRLRFTGPFNFQVKQNGDDIYIYEINARFAGTGILSVAAGANLPALTVKQISGEKLAGFCSFKEGVFISRYVEDCFITEKDLKKQ